MELTAPGMRRPAVVERDRFVDIALVVPLTGSAGMFGPSCELCSQLAVEELNAARGVLGRFVRLRVIDGSGWAPDVAARVGRLARSGEVSAVVGWHLSSVRRAMAPKLAGLVPYVYTALYEGGEEMPHVYLTGETPPRQLLPGMRWLAEERGVRRWFVIGNDYVWPRRTAAQARRFADECGGTVCDMRFVPLGTQDFGSVLNAIERSRADAVVMLLVGEDAVVFNRGFAQRGLHNGCIRLSTLMDENMLLGSGGEATADLWTLSAYFEALVTSDSLDFGRRYVERFGAHAPPLNSMGESCYEGLRLLGALVERAGSFDPEDLARVADGTSYGGPRGEVDLRDRHLNQPIYLAQASGLDFNVVATV